MAEKTIETPPMIEEKSPTKIQTHQEEHKEESEWHQKAKIFLSFTQTISLLS